MDDVQSRIIFGELPRAGDRCDTFCNFLRRGADRERVSLGDFEDRLSPLSSANADHHVPVSHRRQHLRLEVFRLQSRLDFRIGSQEPLVRAASDGAGGDLRRRVVNQHFKLSVFSQPFDSAIRESSGLVSRDDLVRMQPVPCVQMGSAILASENDCKYGSSPKRSRLISLFQGRMISAPFFPVQFADFWLADQLNSLVTALMDFQFLLCFYFTGTSDWTSSSLTGVSNCMENDFIFRPIVNCLPAWFRFAQCLRRYRDSREAFPHLVNAGKYSTTFLVVIFATLRNFNAHKFESTFDNPYTYAWFVSHVISSCYALTWDLKMDWGLFDKNAGENTLLREEIVYSSSVSHSNCQEFSQLGLTLHISTDLLLLRDHRGHGFEIHLDCFFRSHGEQARLR